MSVTAMDKLGDPALLAPYVQAKVQTVKDGRGGIVAYIEARDAAQILDDVVGPDGWEFTHSPPELNDDDWWVTGKLSIRAEDGAWVRKGDIGTGSMKDSTLDTAIKGAVSDCLKRCAVHWGIGRALYRLAFEWVDLVDGRMSKKDKAEIEAKWAKALLAMSNGGEVVTAPLPAEEQPTEPVQPTEPLPDAQPTEPLDDEPMGEQEAVAAVKEEFDATEEPIPPEEAETPPADHAERTKVARRRYNSLKSLAESLDVDWSVFLDKLGQPVGEGGLGVSAQIQFCDEHDVNNTVIFDDAKRIIQELAK